MKTVKKVTFQGPWNFGGKVDIWNTKTSSNKML